MEQANKVILEKKCVYVYNLPFEITQNPMLLNRASNWDLPNPMKLCNLTLTGAGPSCHIQLDSGDGEVFGQSVIEFYPGGNGRSSALCSVTDSRRYFSLKVRKCSGEYDFLGLGFSNRKDSSDLTKTLKNYFMFRNHIDEKGPVDSLSKFKSETKLEQITKNVCRKIKADENDTLGFTHSFAVKAQRVCKPETETIGGNLEASCTVGQSQGQHTLLDDFKRANPKEQRQQLELQQQKLGPEANEASNKQENSVEIIFPKRKIYKSNLFRSRKYERRLALKCNLSIPEAEKLHKNIIKLVISPREKRLQQLELDPCQSMDKSCGGFRYRLPQKRFQCHLCPVNFLRSGRGLPLKTHWKIIHGIKILNCIRCGLIFSNEAQFSLHKKLAHDYACFVCHASLDDMRTIRSHLLKIHIPALLELVANQNLTETDASSAASKIYKGTNQNTVDDYDPAAMPTTAPDEKSLFKRIKKPKKKKPKRKLTGEQDKKEQPTNLYKVPKLVVDQEEVDGNH